MILNQLQHRLYYSTNRVENPTNFRICFFFLNYAIITAEQALQRRKIQTRRYFIIFDGAKAK